MAETGTEIAAGGLTAQQEAFVAARMMGKTSEEAMAESGYAPTDLPRILRDSAISGAIESGIRALATHRALDAFHLITQPKRLAPSDRVAVEAAKAVLAIAGHVGPSRSVARERTTNLADLDSEGLRALVDQLQGELAMRATPVNAPIVRQPSRKAADLLA